jgi:hypothetical protein
MMLSVQQARELLGEEAVGMTDAQLADTIAALDAIADMALDRYIDNCKQATTQREEAA